MPLITVNKKVFFDYEIMETFEAGLALFGHEVKAIKTGHISLDGAYVVVKEGEAYLLNAKIPAYQPANVPKEYDPARSRKLLLHKKELNYLIGKSHAQGLTLVPLRVYTKRSKIKLEFGLAKGKRKYEKRELIKKRETGREIERGLKTWG